MANLTDHCTPCDDPLQGCPSVFDRVIVSYLKRGGGKVQWELLPTFTDPQPHTFQLQAGYTNNPNQLADVETWSDVGDPVIDTYEQTDPDQRNWNKINRTYYRVKLTTVNGEYYSDPVGGLGTLDPRDWRIAREQLRKEMLRMKKGTSGQEGFLLRRRIYGDDCPTCLDYLTGEITDPDCPDCRGTGKRCGYYFPMDCVWADISPKTYRAHQDGGQARGTINDIVVRARMLNTWLLGEEDVWVNRKTDDRYAIHTVQNIVEVRGIPVVADVELRPFPDSASIYDLIIPGQ